MEWIVWPIILVVILAFEAKALINHIKHDTLSEGVWWLRTRLWGRLLLFPLWSWVTYHFFIEAASMNPQSGVWWDDFLIIGIFLGLAIARDYEDYHVTKTVVVDKPDKG